MFRSQAMQVALSRRLRLGLPLSPNGLAPNPRCGGQFDALGNHNLLPQDRPLGPTNQSGEPGCAATVLTYTTTPNVPAVTAGALISSWFTAPPPMQAHFAAMRPSCPAHGKPPAVHGCSGRGRLTGCGTPQTRWPVECRGAALVRDLVCQCALRAPLCAPPRPPAGHGAGGALSVAVELTVMRTARTPMAGCPTNRANQATAMR